MGKLIGDVLAQFEELHYAGQNAKNEGHHDVAERNFSDAATLARDVGDDLKLQHALNPLARAQWSQGKFDAAQGALEEAHSKAPTHDEWAIAESNIGRLAARKVLSQITPTMPKARATQARKLREEALPHFKKANVILVDDPHLYYRYANATHGSVIAALSGDRRWALRFVAQGVRVAWRQSPAQYGHERPVDVNRKGLSQMVGALALTPLGSYTPVLAHKARRQLVR